MCLMRFGLVMMASGSASNHAFGSGAHLRWHLIVHPESAFEIAFEIAFDISVLLSRQRWSFRKICPFPARGSPLEKFAPFPPEAAI